MSAFAQRRNALSPETDARAANQLRSILAAGGEVEQRLSVTIDNKRTAEIVLSPDLSRLLMEVMRVVGRGDAVTLLPVGKMLTTQQAADILNVSRPFLISLLERGEIPYHTVGRHRRIRAEDLFAYQRQRDEARATALAELARIDADLL